MKLKHILKVLSMMNNSAIIFVEYENETSIFNNLKLDSMLFELNNDYSLKIKNVKKNDSEIFPEITVEIYKEY